MSNLARSCLMHNNLDEVILETLNLRFQEEMTAES